MKRGFEVVCKTLLCRKVHLISSKEHYTVEKSKQGEEK